MTSLFISNPSLQKKVPYHFLFLMLSFLLLGCGPRSYDECMLEKMKGQNTSMWSTVDRVCERNHPYEKILYGYKDELDIGWSTGIYDLNLVIKENRGDYRITRYKAVFSKKTCEEAKSASDFTLKRVFSFAKGETKSKVTEKDSVFGYQCMRTEEILGIRNK